MAAASECTTMPVEAPAIDIRPARRPLATVWPRKSVMSGPGVTVSAMAASVKAAIVARDGMNSIINCL
jgi:hypothetical protein